MGAHDGVDDRQSESASASSTGASRIGSVEAFEHPRRNVGRHARSFVGDGKDDRLALHAHLDVHRGARRGVAQRVGQKVRCDLAQLRLVAEYDRDLVEPLVLSENYEVDG